jgi:hypothetical protein
MNFFIFPLSYLLLAEGIFPIRQIWVGVADIMNWQTIVSQTHPLNTALASLGCYIEWGYRVKMAWISGSSHPDAQAIFTSVASFQ